MDEAGPSRKRRRGGVSQRSWQSTKEVEVGSVLLQLLVAKFAAGIFSAETCEEIAKAAGQDLANAAAGKKIPDLQQLVGQTKPNRFLMSAIMKKCSFAQPATINMPYLDGEFPATILLPHEFFAAMFLNQTAWRSTVLPLDGNLPKFWDAVAGHPMLINHPIHERADARFRCVPLAIHGDEVPVVGVGKIWSRSALIFSWFSLLALAAGSSTLDTMVYVWGVFEKFVQPDSTDTHGTMQTFWSIMKWSFEALWAGKWPACDWRGIRPNLLKFTCDLVFSFLQRKR